MASRSENRSKSKIRFRGKMLVAWFGDAKPPVLWRWPASEVSSGFGTRQEGDHYELVKYEAGSPPSVVAIFSSEERAEQALEVLSQTMLKHDPFVGRVAKGVLATIGAVFILVSAVTLVRVALLPSGAPASTSAQANASAQGAALTAMTNSFMPQGYTPPSVSPSAMRSQTAQPSAPAAPPMGAPVDVDSFYH